MLPKGVHKVTSRGHEYFYFQAGRGTVAPGPRMRLPLDPQSPEFWHAVRDAQGVSQVEATNTVDIAVTGYLASVANSVGEETLYNYTRSLSIARTAWGSLPIAGVRPAHVMKVMEGLSATPGKANNFLTQIKLLSAWARTQDLIDKSMAEGVKAYKLTGGHRPWTAAQIAAGEQYLTGVIRRGLMLYRYTGMRGSDIVKLGPTDVDDGGFNIKQQKTGREVWCPIVPELAAEMATWDRRPGPFLRQEDGATYTRNLFWDHFDKQREHIPELASVTLHGLRCTAVIRLRQAGLSVPQISDIVGMSLATVQRYCRFADRKESGKAALVMLDERRTKKEVK